MFKNIILLSDGTGNSSSKLFKTNVWRLYDAIDLTDPKVPTQPRQFAFYDNGVGTSSFRPLAMLGGALGVGLARNVRDLYAFLCRTYSPGDGTAASPADKIYAFGFSRGAFTIRVLIGLIMEEGLVPYNGNEAELKRLTAHAYRAYRRKCAKATGGLVGPLRAMRDAIIGRWDRFRGRIPYEKVQRIGTRESERPIEIEFLGLWDTVDAYGLPVDELTRAIDLFIWPLTMRDYRLSPRVKRARHALSLDDERNTFHPRLWDEASIPADPATGRGAGNRDTETIDEERISQVWFAGVHANVGGGYPDDSLAHVSLGWMMTEAKKYQLRLTPEIEENLRALADESGPIYDSRHGLAGYYRYNPRRIDKLIDTEKVKVPRPKIHESVFRRIKIGQDGYAPIVLPTRFAVVQINGAIVDGATYLASRPQPTGDAQDQVSPGPAGDVWGRLGAHREHVWNWVWWRRIVYFSTLGVTFLLALMPLIWPALPKGACVSQACFATHAIDAVAAVLPGFAATWTDAFSSNPGVFLFLCGLLVAGLVVGGILRRRIRDTMRPIWYAIPRTTPRDTPFPLPEPPSALNRGVEWLRQRPGYRAFFWTLTHRVLPGGFLLALVYAAVAIATQVTFAVRASWGAVCRSDRPGDRVERSAETSFRTDGLCTATGLFLEKGATYRLRITIPAGDRWTDRGIPAGPNGVRSEDTSFRMTAAVPLRRHIAQRWYKPMARIGQTGTDEYPLDPKPSLAEAAAPATQAAAAPQADVTFETELVARSDGPLFFYVNDAVLDLPFLPNAVRTAFYRNNTGSARVTVERLTQSPPLN